MRSDPIKTAFVFRLGRGADVSGYRSAAFRNALVEVGVDPVMIDVADDENPRLVGAPSDSVSCRERELPEILRAAAPELVQTFGPESELRPVWSAAAHGGRPLLHFVQSTTTGRNDRRGPLARRLSALMQSFSPSRHVTGVLGSSRTAVCRAIEAGLFPAATFSRVIAPPIQLPADTATSPDCSPRATFGVYDPYGTEDDLRFVLQAITSSGHTNLFSVKLACPAYRLPPVLPRNVTAIAPGDPAEFVRSVDALILPYDADHLVAPLVTALQAGKTAIVPDGGVASELIGFGRAGVLFTAGSAYDLALKINIVTGSSSDQPLAFRGGAETVRTCAPDEVAKAFAASFQFALTSAAGA